MGLVVEAEIDNALSIVWNAYAHLIHIVNWNFASEDWCCPEAHTDLQPGGKFTYRMQAKDGTIGFDYSGQYIQVVNNQLLTYLLDDGRKVVVNFIENNEKVHVRIEFEPEDFHPHEIQQQGWQAILNQFKKYMEKDRLEQ